MLDRSDSFGDNDSLDIKPKLVFGSAEVVCGACGFRIEALEGTRGDTSDLVCEIA
jgi:hypothetical protein